jgi:hypothetical protein
MAGGRLLVRLTAAERAQLEAFADTESLPLARAAAKLMRSALAAPAPATATEPSAPTQDDLATEIALHNLVATEQALRLLESMVRQGPGAADGVLAAASHAAQHRLSSSTSVTAR